MYADVPEGQHDLGISPQHMWYGVLACLKLRSSVVP